MLDHAFARGLRQPLYDHVDVRSLETHLDFVRGFVGFRRSIGTWRSGGFLWPSRGLRLSWTSRVVYGRRRIGLGLSRWRIGIGVDGRSFGLAARWIGLSG